MVNISLKMGDEKDRKDLWTRKSRLSLPWVAERITSPSGQLNISSEFMMMVEGRVVEAPDRWSGLRMTFESQRVSRANNLHEGLKSQINWILKLLGMKGEAHWSIFNRGRCLRWDEVHGDQAVRKNVAHSPRRGNLARSFPAYPYSVCIAHRIPEISAVSCLGPNRCPSGSGQVIVVCCGPRKPLAGLGAEVDLVSEVNLWGGQQRWSRVE